MSLQYSRPSPPESLENHSTEDYLSLPHDSAKFDFSEDPEKRKFDRVISLFEEHVDHLLSSHKVSHKLSQSSKGAHHFPEGGC